MNFCHFGGELVKIEKCCVVTNERNNKGILMSTFFLTNYKKKLFIELNTVVLTFIRHPMLCTCFIAKSSSIIMYINQEFSFCDFGLNFSQ